MIIDYARGNESVLMNTNQFYDVYFILIKLVMDGSGYVDLSPEYIYDRLARYGVKFNKCKPFRNKIYRGMVATDNIKKGEVVMSVGDRLCVIKDSQIECIEHFIESDSPIYQLQKDIFLSNDYSTFPTFWSDEELARIEGTIFYQRLMQYKRQLMTTYLDLVDKYPNCSGPFLKRMVFGIASRVWGYNTKDKDGKPKRKIIMQLGTDLYNHSTYNYNVELDFKYNNNDTTLQCDSIANRDIMAGEELFISYGHDSNYDFMLLYGFFEERDYLNTYDEYVKASIDPNVSYNELEAIVVKIEEDIDKRVLRKQVMMYNLAKYNTAMLSYAEAVNDMKQTIADTIKKNEGNDNTEINNIPKAMYNEIEKEEHDHNTKATDDGDNKKEPTSSAKSPKEANIMADLVNEYMNTMNNTDKQVTEDKTGDIKADETKQDE